MCWSTWKRSGFCALTRGNTVQRALTLAGTENSFAAPSAPCQFVIATKQLAREELAADREAIATSFGIRKRQQHRKLRTGRLSAASARLSLAHRGAVDQPASVLTHQKCSAHHALIWVSEIQPGSIIDLGACEYLHVGRGDMA